MKKQTKGFFLLAALTLSACGTPTPKASETDKSHPKTEETSSFSPDTSTNYTLTKMSTLDWSPLNPARGDKSPQAGTIWGNRSKNETTGFLVKFAEGFSSPPHIHNITYKGIVIEGEVYNGDPASQALWMPWGSFWVQPAGQGHITSARATSNMAYIEIEEGPYLVHPVDDAFDKQEFPLNIHRNNYVWLNANVMAWLKTKGTALTLLWGSLQENKLSGTLLKIPAGFSGKICSMGPEFRAMLVRGGLDYSNPKNTAPTSLTAGDYFASDSRAAHTIKNTTNDEVWMYVRTRGGFFVE